MQKRPRNTYSGYAVAFFIRDDYLLDFLTAGVSNDRHFGILGAEARGSAERRYEEINREFRRRSFLGKIRVGSRTYFFQFPLFEKPSTRSSR